MTRSLFAFCALLLALVVLPVTQSGTPARAASNDFAAWVEYKSPDGVFTLSFPVDPVVEVLSFTEAGTKVNLTTIKTDNGAFSLVVHEAEIPGPAARDPLDYITRPDREGRTLDYVRVISLGSVPGREMLSFQDGIWVRERFYWTGDRLYNLIAMSRIKNESEEFDRHFFETFRLNS